MSDYCYRLVKGFLANSMPAVRVLTKSAKMHREEKICQSQRVVFSWFGDGKKLVDFSGSAHFYLRGSVEYANSQLTAEELQGIIGLRLLQTCVNYCLETDMQYPMETDYRALCEELKGPPKGYVLPFLLNTDDIEADRYSINPLRQSLMDSGQSAFPVANIKTGQLYVDSAFVEKYDGALISKEEVELITEELSRHEKYMDFVDSVKFRQLETLSNVFGINFDFYTLRMPLSILQTEKKDDILHYIISKVHNSYQSIKQAYDCMGRSIAKRSTLLAVPHSQKGYGSKRAAHGKIQLKDDKLLNVNVKYKPTTLYSNGIDPKDVAITHGEDDFTVEGERFVDYNYSETPASPQFFLYALASPENATLWHGIGVFAASQLLQTYVSAHKACNDNRLIPGLTEKFSLIHKVPLSFNLVPEGMWRNPKRQNIDASIGTVKDLNTFVNRGIWLEHITKYQ